MNFIPTTEIASRGSRRDTSREFFGMFPAAWDAVRCQVSKLETRQAYWEPDSPSWQAAQDGNWDESMQLLAKSREVDVPLYADLRGRGVEFLRCRPLVFPLSPYLRWEREVYRFNTTHGERIFCCNRATLGEVFDDYAKHDFMIFDARLAYIHDYDGKGENVGGWRIENQDDIRSLIALFAFIKAHCHPYDRIIGS